MIARTAYSAFVLLLALAVTGSLTGAAPVRGKVLNLSLCEILGLPLKK